MAAKPKLGVFGGGCGGFIPHFEIQRAFTGVDVVQDPVALLIVDVVAVGFETGKLNDARVTVRPLVDEQEVGAVDDQAGHGWTPILAIEPPDALQGEDMLGEGFLGRRRFDGRFGLKGGDLRGKGRGREEQEEECEQGFHERAGMQGTGRGDVSTKENPAEKARHQGQRRAGGDGRGVRWTRVCGTWRRRRWRR